MKEAKKLKMLKRSLIMEQEKNIQLSIVPVPTPIREIKEEESDVDMLKENKQPQQQQQQQQEINKLSNEIVNNIFNSSSKLPASDFKLKKTSDIKKGRKKKKKKKRMTSAQKYELELQELSNSFLLQNILVEYLELKSNNLGMFNHEIFHSNNFFYHFLFLFKMKILQNRVYNSPI